MGHDPQLREMDSTRLDSWKEIASFLHRDARTVRRWERERHLPVHRVPGGERSGVFAYVGEIERWLHASEAAPAARTETATDGPMPVAFSLAPAPSVPGDVEAEAAAEPRPPVSAFQSLNRFPVGAATEAASASETSGSRPGPSLTPLLYRSLRIRGYQAASLLALLLVAIGISAAVVRMRANRPIAPAIHQPNPEAKELYLRGRYYWNLRTEEGLNCALDLFTQSIVHDPKYAAAYAGLADSYLLLRQYGHMPNSEAFPRALAAAKQAIALDDSSPEAHRSLAFIRRFWDWDMAAAEKEYRRAIALNPSDPQSHHWFATALLSAGRDREALEQIDQARALDPGSGSVLADRGLILAELDPRAGAEALQQVEQAQPAFLSTHTYLSRTYLRLGDYAGFLKEFRQAAEIAHDPAMLLVLNPMMERAQRTLAERGPMPMLRGLAEDLAPLADRGAVYAYDEARLFGLAGEPGKAISYLRLACDRREPGFLGADGDPAFAALRSQPEYMGLMVRRDAGLNSRQPVAQLDGRRGL
jgi:tetratricopeptide (TPR) repeat protein